MSAIAIDTPDGQRGVVSAQLLLASVGAGTNHVTVGVPPNAETLIVAVPSANVQTRASCIGFNTGYSYPGARVGANDYVGGSSTFFFDASSVQDTEVVITLNPGPGGAWEVYADSAAHIIADASKRVDSRGQQYVIPTVPSTAATDHPINELQFASQLFIANGTLVASPGSTSRIRVFGAWMTSAGSATTGLLTDSVSGTSVLGLEVPGTIAMPVPLTGLPLTENAALHYALLAGTAGVLVGAYYTTEFV